MAISIVTIGGFVRRDRRQRAPAFLLYEKVIVAVSCVWVASECLSQCPK